MTYTPTYTHRELSVDMLAYLAIDLKVHASTAKVNNTRLDNGYNFDVFSRATMANLKRVFPI